MTKKMIAIWAEDEQGLIGHKDRLPWHLPKELQHFKATTMGQALIMGRVTFDGMGRRVLPGRQTLILSRQADFDAEGIQAFSSPEAVLHWFDQQDKDLYVVGGASVYEAFWPYCDRLVKTTVAGSFEGDTYFPDLTLAGFDLVSETHYPEAVDNPHAFRVQVYEKERN